MNANRQALKSQSLAFARQLAETYFVRRALDLLPRYMDEAVTCIGTGPDEISGSLSVLQQALDRELAECPGAMALKSLQLEAVPCSDSVCVVYGAVLAVPEDSTMAEEDVRISLVLQQQPAGMKLLHAHISRADAGQEHGRYCVSKAARADLKSMRKALDARGRQLENLTKNIPGGVHQCKNDPNFTLISMSDSFLTLSGYTRQEVADLYHDRFMEMIYPADQAGALQMAHEQLKHGPDIELEYRILCKNGPPIWILDKGRLLDDGEGGKCFYCLLIDITVRKRQEEALRLSLERHQVIMDQATDIIFEWDIPADTLQFSPNWRKKFGYDPISDRISGRIPMSRNIHPEDMPAFVKIMHDTAAGVPYSEAEFRIKNTTGKYRWFRIRATAQFDADGHSIKAVGVITDIDAEKKQKQMLLDMAQKDALTGLYNKAATANLVEQRMNRMGCPAYQALLILDVDRFKEVNDTFGHMTGDSVLSDVAATLRRSVRESDLVGRIGGDEFLVYLSDVTDEAAAMAKAKRLRAALGKLSPEPGAPPITCSIGVAVYPYGAVDYLTLYRNADQALYRRKNSGRDGVTLYDRTQEAVADLQTAVSSNVVSDEENVSDERLAQYAFRALYTARDTVATMDRLLEIIGRSFDVSRAYIFENTPDDLCCSNTFEWCAEGVAPQKASLQNVPYEILDNYRENFDQNGLFYCAQVSKTLPSVRAVLEPQGIRSMLQCAILDEGKFLGYVGFDECRENRQWSGRQVAAFKLTADVLAIFLVKHRQKQKLLGF